MPCSGSVPPVRGSDGERRGGCPVMGKLRHSDRAMLTGSSDPATPVVGSGENGHDAQAMERLLQVVDPRTRALVAERQGVTTGRSYLIRRWLLASDVVALTAAILLSIALT